MKQKVESCWLGDYQEELLCDMKMNAPTSTKKLIQTLFPKKIHITLSNAEAICTVRNESKKATSSASF